VTTKILTLGIDNDDIENLDIRDGKVLLKTKTLRELESVLDEGEEVGTILVDSHFLTSPKEELRTILGLTSLTTKIVLQYYADDELDLDSLRQLGIDLLEAPLTSDGWQALTEGH
jgi:vacuolar-type H+-ATPase subunit F/Vma7